jgi:hypothetical protein
METGRRWIGYDTFKLLVFLVLAGLVVALQLQVPFLSALAPGAAGAPTPLAALPSFTPPAAVPPTPSPTAVPQATPTAQALPSDTPAPSSTPEATSTPAVTLSPTPLVTSDLASCPSALKSYLKVGRAANVTTTLNLRSSPDFSGNTLDTLVGDTHVVVIDGPVCVPFLDGAYIWWKIRLANGLTGWAVEGSLTGNTYFLRLLP